MLVCDVCLSLLLCETWMTGNNIGAVGATALADSLKTCSALQTLNLYGASMSVRVSFVFDVDWC